MQQALRNNGCFSWGVDQIIRPAEKEDRVLPPAEVIPPLIFLQDQKDRRITSSLAGSQLLRLWSVHLHRCISTSCHHYQFGGSEVTPMGELI